MDSSDAPVEATKKKGLWAKLKTFVADGRDEHGNIVRRARPLYAPNVTGNASSDSGSCTSSDAMNGRPSRGVPKPIGGARDANRVYAASSRASKGDRRLKQSSVEQLSGFFTDRQLFELVYKAALEALPLRMELFSLKDQWNMLKAALHRKYGKSKSAVMANQLMQRPDILAALQGKLSGLAKDATLVSSLPKPVQRRVKALKKLQASLAQLEAKFYEEIHGLECKYNDEYAPLFDKRKDVLMGTVEPSESDCDWPSDEDEDADEESSAKDRALAGQVKEKLQLQESEDTKAPCKGIPFFWLTTLKNVDMLASMIQDYDEPILEHLTDIRVQLSKDPMGFTLEFYFSPNEHFTDTVLTKWYEMSAAADDDPLEFEGPEITKCKGCTIHWNKGKDVTVKLVKKKQKHKGRGTTRMITKAVKTDSFFNFFSPPEVPEEQDDELEEEAEALLETHFEIGQFIRERIVPRAVLYFTGELLDDQCDDEEDDEEGEGDYDEDEDPDYDPECDTKAPAAVKQECKQQ